MWHKSKSMHSAVIGVLLCKTALRRFCVHMQSHQHVPNAVILVARGNAPAAKANSAVTCVVVQECWRSIRDCFADW